MISDKNFLVSNSVSMPSAKSAPILLILSLKASKKDVHVFTALWGKYSQHSRFRCQDAFSRLIGLCPY